jgi:hypothetical protein
MDYFTAIFTVIWFLVVAKIVWATLSFLTPLPSIRFMLSNLPHTYKDEKTKVRVAEEQPSDFQDWDSRFHWHCIENGIYIQCSGMQRMDDES